MQETSIQRSFYKQLFRGCQCHQKCFIETLANLFKNIQKQPPEVFYEERCPQKFHRIHRKKPEPELELGIPAALLKQRIWHRCFPVNFVKFLRTPFLQNTTGRLLLNTYSRCSAGPQPGTSSQFHFLIIFLLGTSFFRNA